MNELEILQNDAGNPIFVDVAESYRSNGEMREALDVCLKGLSANPSCHLGRLVLARVFYERGDLPFAAREVRELCSQLPEIESLRRLFKSLAPDGQHEVPLSAQISSQPVPVKVEPSGNDTVAEAEFDLDEIDILEEDLKNK